MGRLAGGLFGCLVDMMLVAVIPMGVVMPVSGAMSGAVDMGQSMADRSKQQRQHQQGDADPGAAPKSP